MYLGVDYGKKRIGLAIGEAIPKPLTVIDGSKPQDEILADFKEIVEREQIKGLVVGLPERDDMKENGLNLEIKKFANNLKQNLNLELYYEPEQYTSAEAERILKKYNVQIIGNKEKIDKLAAVLILEQFLERRKSEG